MLLLLLLLLSFPFNKVINEWANLRLRLLLIQLLLFSFLFNEAVDQSPNLRHRLCLLLVLLLLLSLRLIPHIGPTGRIHSEMQVAR